MKSFRHIALLLLSGLLFLTCNQDPIFYEISLEVEPVPPRIPGAPTNIVEVGSTMYVASKRGSTIYQYADSAWSTPLPSPGKILELAATTNKLYALVGDPGSASLKRLDPADASPAWQEVSGAGSAQSIYGAGAYLFAGNATLNADSNPPLACSMSSVDETGGSLSPLASSGGGLLSGAAVLSDGSSYYLATSGSGIFIYDNSLAVTSRVTTYPNIVGIINVNDTIVAVSREGYVLYSDSAAFTPVATGLTFTGALGIYEKGAVNLLLLGIRGSSTSTIHGYREIVLEGGEFPTSVGWQTPGTIANSSVTGEDQYTVTIGAQPLSTIFQAADGTPFASTAQAGLWSYRQHGDKSYWNSEE
ncbi:MAG: hypothetical protein LBS86_00465 [Treponema sp.]|jgi:hypothetical protein|nr:hypothetical protein [Treponema sp.]